MKITTCHQILNLQEQQFIKIEWFIRTVIATRASGKPITHRGSSSVSFKSRWITIHGENSSARAGKSIS